MPTCPRCAFLALFVAFLTFTGCDSSNPGRDLEIVAGNYVLTDLEFRTTGASGIRVDVVDELDLGEVRLRIFRTEDDEALLEIGTDRGVTDLIELTVSPSRGRVRLDAADNGDEEDLAALLFPDRFTLTYEGETANRLEADITLDSVNLEEFSDRYEGVRDVSGTLSVTFER